MKAGDTLRSSTELLGISPNTRLASRTFHDVDFSKVYATTDFDLARDYAARWSALGEYAHAVVLTNRNFAWERGPWEVVDPGHEGGALYRVRLLGTVLPDPDYPAGVSYLATKGTVLEVVEPHIPFCDRPSRSTLHYQEWDDGSRRFDDEGFALPSPEMRAFGLTPADFRHLGYAPDLNEVNQVAIDAAAARGLQAVWPDRGHTPNGGHTAAPPAPAWLRRNS